MPYFDWPGAPVTTASKLREIVESVEEAGFSSFWVMDHLFQLGGAFGEKDAPLPEAYTTLSYIAGITKTIKLGVLVTNNVLRYPGVLVKMVTTLDVLSGGRMYLGIGPGGQVEREIKGYGIHRPSLGERISRFEETLQIAHHMWSDNRAPFNGKYFQLEAPICSPQPISLPHPPILIGMWRGGSRMLSIAARYADAVNLQFGSPLPEFQDWMHEKYEERRTFIIDTLGRLRRLCEEYGRNYDGIEKTILGTVRIAPDAMNVQDVLGICVELGELGIEQVILNMPNSHEIAPIETIGDEVI
ncbi:MAG: LLM class flavin-dependent oxidoreductase, partial [Dehalococcoidia bacterium]|nr:LLM class flavin-dependent oxidoreductase [Dehalococcoidia bacterium]